MHWKYLSNFTGKNFDLEDQRSVYLCGIFILVSETVKVGEAAQQIWPVLC